MSSASNGRFLALAYCSSWYREAVAEIGHKSFGAHFLGMLLVPILLWATGTFAQEGETSRECSIAANSQIVDRVWGGTRVRFEAVETASSIFVGYYDADRWLTIAEIEKCSGKITKVRLPSRFGGWDAHNHVRLALDEKERLHVAGNMHVTPLTYARMMIPGDLNSLTYQAEMVGDRETNTSYPAFFRFPDGALGFTYRSGRSGDGEQVVNRLSSDRWDRWIDKPLLASAPGKPRVNAYPTHFVQGPDGFFHMAWVWRSRGGVETNFDVGYAKSRDLKNWTDSSGRPYTLPITPVNQEVVDAVPPNSGLFNNIQLGFDRVARPVVSYLKFDNRGFTQLWHARFEVDHWHVYRSTQWSYRWDPRGGGTMVPTISFSGVDTRDSSIYERVRHPELGSVTLEFDESTFQVKRELAGPAGQSLKNVRREAARGTVVSTETVKSSRNHRGARYAISWLSMPADNGDKPRSCQIVSPIDCAFVYDLQLHRLPSQ